ncbi:MAG TPA: tetratricopeptide repeat protein [Ktedonobacteraceae bacterium]|nr:tetratricopeptide repeat protein [Ktedonobacteraceae bacterium]
MAHSLRELAQDQRQQGKYAEAEPLFQRALAIFELRLGPEHRLIDFTEKAPGQHL